VPDGALKNVTPESCREQVIAYVITSELQHMRLLHVIAVAICEIEDIVAGIRRRKPVVSENLGCRLSSTIQNPAKRHSNYNALVYSGFPVDT
jgi:hypothetical protein